VRFDSARAAGLDEDRAALVADGYEARLPAREAAALALTDLLIGVPRPPEGATCEALQQEFDAGDIVELMLGVSCFLGMSKVLITLGLEPEEMATTVLPTPGSVAVE